MPIAATGSAHDQPNRLLNTRPDQQDGRQIAAQQCLLGIGYCRKRSDFAARTPLREGQRGHDKQAERGQADPDR